MALTQLWDAVKQALWSGHEAKVFIEQSVAVSNDALHMTIGVLAVFVVAALVRKPLSHWLPWMAVLFAVVINEAVDFWVGTWPNAPRQFGESVKDVALTMLLPTLIFLTSRYAPGLYGRGSSSGADR